MLTERGVPSWHPAPQPLVEACRKAMEHCKALYSIIQMPPGIPVATVAINGAMNAAILAIQMLALSDEKLAEAFAAYKEGLKKKIVKANEELKEVKFEYKTN